ncbi:MAG: ATP-binding cassette domain-containing protein [Bacilli bacterium]
MHLIDPIKHIIDFNLIYKKYDISFKRINEVYSIKNESMSDENKINKNLIGNIKVNNLNFSHIHNPILKNLNLNIKSGSKVLIKGNSGSGKSTFLKLLCKFYEVDNNKIFIDDIDLNNYSINCIRSNIRYVSQNELLFNDTIYNNISIDEEKDLEKVINICEKFDINTIYDKSNLGLNMLIEENGFNLSGGEKQRIILARSIYKNFDILIIDEALSEIDIKLERKILKFIFKEFKDKTILIVSHRSNNSDLFNECLDFGDYNDK